jgi:hypothetical protein
MAYFVSDSNAAHDSSASVMEMTKAIEQISLQAPNFTRPCAEQQAHEEHVASWKGFS